MLQPTSKFFRPVGDSQPASVQTFFTRHYNVTEARFSAPASCYRANQGHGPPAPGGVRGLIGGFDPSKATGLASMAGEIPRSRRRSEGRQPDSRCCGWRENRAVPPQNRSLTAQINRFFLVPETIQLPPHTRSADHKREAGQYGDSCPADTYQTPTAAKRVLTGSPRPVAETPRPGFAARCSRTR